MRAGEGRRQRRTHPERERRGALQGGAGFALLNAAFLDAVLLVGAVAAWPIYGSGAYALLVLAGLACANGLALLAALRHWRAWQLAAAGAALYLLLGVPLAAPSSLNGPVELLQGLLGVLTAPVTGWKDLLTLTLPLGSYHATLAPALLVLLGAALVGLSLAWRARRLWPLAAPAALLMLAFAVLFGSSATSRTLTLGGWRVDAPVELGIGAASLVLLLAWFAWRSAHDRRSALRRGRRLSGVRPPAGSRRAAARGALVGGGMLVVALGVGGLLAPLAVAGTPREVLRTGVDPVLELQDELSPLSVYRQYFTPALYDRVLFQVQGVSTGRVRLATLPFYDGQVASVTDDTGSAGTGGPATAFTRVPSALAPLVPGSEVKASVTIEGYQGVWVPLVGQLSAVDFTGTDRRALSDGFYYDAATRTGVELSPGGLGEGDSYEQTAVVPEERRDAAELAPSRTGPALPAAVVPQSLLDWIKAQDAPSGGAGLQLLLQRLRDRGFLSHALLPPDPATGSADWASDLGSYSFEPSRAGHSTDRIGQLFSALLSRQAEVGGTDDSRLVAAVGDDEQFAVAAAMIADQLGFPARVVLGARLGEAAQTDPAGGDATAADIPACEGGVCRGANMTAWVEVQDASGAWTALDVTPQHTQPLAPQQQEQRDPEIPTQVDPSQATPVLPPESQPGQAGDEQPSSPEGPADLGWLWIWLRVGGIVLAALLVVLGPLLAIVLLKAARRRSRRRAPELVERITGGWEEYVDCAVDHGLPPPRAETRSELARLYGAEQSGAGGLALATWADRSVFAPEPPDEAQSALFWELVDSERQRFDDGAGFWRRLRALLSLRSLSRRAGRA